MAARFSTAVMPAPRSRGNLGSPLNQPYVAVTRIDLRPPRAELEVLLYGAWQSTDPDVHADVAPLIWREGIWEFELSAPPLQPPDDVVVLVALIEHFGGEPCAFKSLIRNAVIQVVDGSAHLSRNTRVACFIDALNRSIDCANGGPNLASAVEFPLPSYDQMLIEAHRSWRFVRSFCGYGGQYCLAIELKAASEVWTSLVPQRHEAIAWAGA